MKLCSKCNRIVTADSYCTDVECPSLDIVTAGEAPKVEPASSSAPENMAFCGECGTAMKHGAAFCGKCGTRAIIPHRDLLVASKPQIPASIANGEAVAEASETLPVEAAEEDIAEPDPATASPQMETNILPVARFCGECGSGLKPSATFCGRCGTPVAAFTSTQPTIDGLPADTQDAGPHETDPEAASYESDRLVEAEPSVQDTEDAPASEFAALDDETGPPPEDESNEWLYPDEPKPLWKRPVIVAPLFLTLLAASAAVYWTQFRESVEQQSSVSGKSESVENVTASQAPLLRGTYKAHLADQDITVSVGEETATTLVNSRGTAEYSNVVNGGKCTASLVPVSGGGVGGSTSNAVNFRQEPVASLPACPKDIPVRIDISEQPKGSDGVVQSIKVEWLSQDEAKVLMSGILKGGQP